MAVIPAYSNAIFCVDVGTDSVTYGSVTNGMDFGKVRPVTILGAGWLEKLTLLFRRTAESPLCNALPAPNTDVSITVPSAVYKSAKATLAQIRKQLQCHVEMQCTEDAVTIGLNRYIKHLHLEEQLPYPRLILCLDEVFQSHIATSETEFGPITPIDPYWLSLTSTHRDGTLSERVDDELARRARSGRETREFCSIIIRGIYSRGIEFFHPKIQHDRIGYPRLVMRPQWLQDNNMSQASLKMLGSVPSFEKKAIFHAQWAALACINRGQRFCLLDTFANKLSLCDKDAPDYAYSHVVLIEAFIEILTKESDNFDDSDLPFFFAAQAYWKEKEPSLPNNQRLTHLLEKLDFMILRIKAESKLEQEVPPEKAVVIGESLTNHVD